MKSRLLLATIAAAGCLVAQETKPTPPPPKKVNIFSFKSPSSAGTVVRQDGDGASRGDGTVPDLLLALTPKQGLSLTTQREPSLYFYLSDETHHEVRLTMTTPGEVKPVFILTMSQCALGIFRVNLADYGLVLPVDVEYVWNVTVRPDPDSKSKDLISWSRIKRVNPTEELTKKLKDAPASEHAAIYAEAGIWYDFFAALRNEISANKNDPGLLAQQKAIFDEVKIDLTPKKPAKPAGGSAPKPAKTGLQINKPSNGAIVRADGDGGNR